MQQICKNMQTCKNAKMKKATFFMGRKDHLDLPNTSKNEHIAQCAMGKRIAQANFFMGQKDQSIGWIFFSKKCRVEKTTLTFPTTSKTSICPMQKLEK